MCIDANARVGSVRAHGVIGECNNASENDNGTRFRTKITNLVLVAVNTFVESAGTWMSSFGTEHRIDYICVSSALFDHVSNTATLVDLDLSTSDRIDHRAMSCKVDLPDIKQPMQPAMSTIRKQRQANFNVDNFKDPVMCARFAHAKKNLIMQAMMLIPITMSLSNT